MGVISPLQPQSSEPYCPPEWVARTSARICIYSTVVEKAAEARINQEGKMNIISACWASTGFWKWIMRNRQQMEDSWWWIQGPESPMQVDILEHSLSHEQRPGRQDLQWEASTAQAMPKSGHSTCQVVGEWFKTSIFSPAPISLSFLLSPPFSSVHHFISLNDKLLKIFYRKLFSIWTKFKTTV